MKLFWSYLRTRTRWLILAAACIAVYAGTSALYRLPAAAVLYPTGLCLLILAGALYADFRRVRRNHQVLARMAEDIGDLIGSLPPPDGIGEQDYQQIIRRLLTLAAQRQAEDMARYDGMVEYYTVWAHQIKTPIASMELALQDEDTPLSRQLKSSLLRIEQYVGMVLTFLRLDADTGDYVFREYPLDDILRRAVRRFAPEFISKKLRLEYHPVSDRILTDEKWLTFVIEQLLSNALKYTREGSVRLYTESPAVLCIEDTGIGIAPEDLPRIFEKGYTGRNGRTDMSASGIGLYLCRRICRQLGIGITARSVPGVGTTVRLDLSHPRIRHE